MPKIPDDMEKCIATTERKRLERIQTLTEQSEREAAEDEELEKFCREFAAEHGIDISEVSLHVSKRGG